MRPREPACARGRPGKLLRGPFFRPLRSLISFAISGVTKNSGGAPLASCTVDLFVVSGNVFVGSTVSDGSGNFAFAVATNTPHFVRTYDAGGTVVGTSGPLTPV